MVDWPSAFERVCGEPLQVAFSGLIDISVKEWDSDKHGFAQRVLQAKFTFASGQTLTGGCAYPVEISGDRRHWMIDNILRMFQERYAAGRFDDVLPTMKETIYRFEDFELSARADKEQS